MFGEKEIIGLKTVAVDNKARIVMPKFTCAETNEELVFYELNKASFSIASLNYLKSKMRELENYGFSTISITSFHEIEKQIETIYSTIVGASKVDKQKRVVIPEFIRENYLPFDFRETNGNVIAQGYGKKLKIFLNSKEFISKQKEI